MILSIEEEKELKSLIDKKQGQVEKKLKEVEDLNLEIKSHEETLRSVGTLDDVMNDDDEEEEEEEEEEDEE